MTCEGLSRRAAYHLFLALAFATVVSGQPKLEPPPAILKVAEQPDGPVRLSITGVQVFADRYRSLLYTVTNASSETVWGLVLTGLEQAEKPTIILGGAIRPNATQSFGIPQVAAKDEPSEKLAAVDFVLFRDGTFWGPDSAGEGEAMRGTFEGQRAFVSDVRRILETNAEAALRELLTKEPYLPEMTRIENKTKHQRGFVRGYGAGLINFRLDMHGRGDLKGIPSRIAEMEEDLGIASAGNDDRKQISRSYWFNEPIKIESLSLGDKRVEIDEKFDAAPDWLRGLRLKVRNNSGRNITHLSLALEFRETIATGSVMMFPLNYGPHPASLGPPKGKVKAETPVLPRGSFEIVMDETEFGLLKKFVGSRHSLDSLKRVNVRVSMIHFSDGTAWNGSWLKQDPTDSRRWLPIEQQ